MIRTLADLIDALRAKEEVALAPFARVEHGPMIGDMYEGLTRALLSQALFDGCDLKVVTGKIEWPGGEMSRQLDAMIVTGEGTQLPYSHHFLYPLRQVIAVVEVKKTLYGEDLREAHLNLQSVGGDLSSEPPPVRRIMRAYRAVAQRDLPADGDLTSLPYAEAMMAHAIIRDSILPVRIVLGYAGYASELTLRQGFINYLESVIGPSPTQGFGPDDFPTVIACAGHALVKMNGMPYSANHDGPIGDWLLYCSLGNQPTLAILEAIWTRLASVFDLPPDIFGEDLEIERLSPLLFARPERKNGMGGWHYREHHLSKSHLADITPVPWQPTPLSHSEAVLLLLLGKREAIDTRSDPDFKAFAAELGPGLTASLEKLRMDGIAAVDDKGILRYLTSECTIAFLPDGSPVAGENSTGRLWRWIAKHGPARPPAGA